MPRLSKETKKEIERLSHKELLQIVLKAASMEKSVYDYISVNFLNKEEGEKALFEATKRKIFTLFYKNYKGRAPQLQTKNMLSESIKAVNEFTKVSKNKNYEADLLVFILDEVFSYPEDFFGTCFTGFDAKAGQIVKRLITLVTKKLHRDYFIEYRDKINHYLNILHRQSNHVNSVYDLPEKVEL